MERIVLEVDSSLASAWKRVPVKLKRQFAKEMELHLKERIREAEKPEFEKKLENLRQQAVENGLTEEMLEQLLNEEE